KQSEIKEWKDYNSAIESTKDTARLRKILSKIHSSLAFVKNLHGSWAESSKERNEILLETHFPGCQQIATEESDCGSKLITYEKAINSFDPFNSADYIGNTQHAYVKGLPGDFRNFFEENEEIKI
uniref:Uncharacterized protein n=1 Tax=Megaselia scalaris TaxID=36166 RepID=T1GX66_MEGSC